MTSSKASFIRLKNSVQHYKLAPLGANSTNHCLTDTPQTYKRQS